MKKLFTTIVLTMFIVTSAKADLFQFMDQSQNDYLRYWQVMILDYNYGYTDGYGRVHINMQNGNYTAILKKNNMGDKVINLQIDGSYNLKIVYVP